MTSDTHPADELLLSFLEAHIESRPDQGRDERWTDLTAHLEACDSCCDRMERLSNRSAVAVAQRPDQPSTSTDVVIRAAEGASTAPPSPRESAVRAARPAVPGYEIADELGRGGMGVVYRARQVRADRMVALKMILGGSLAGPGELARFRTEAEAVARLQHPGIVQIYEVGEAQGLPFFSMELVEGGSLHKKLDGRPLIPKAAAGLTVLLARAVDTAHERGILHRDLKPGNIFLMPTADMSGVAIGSTAIDGVAQVSRYYPKIGDFGLAKKVEGAGVDGASAVRAGLTATGAIVGTPPYMAPEQAGGKTRDITTAVDVYALGAILYEMLTGRPPFCAATPMETLLQVVHDEPAPPRQLNGKTPRDLETICLKCLQKAPSKRYATAQALADDLQRFLNREPIRARPVRQIERAWRWCQRKPALAGLAALCVLLLVGGSATTYWKYLDAREQADIAGKKTTLAEQKTEDVEREATAKEEALQQARDFAHAMEIEAEKARDAAAAAEKARRELREQLANSNVLLSQAAWDHNDVRLARQYLEKVPGEPDGLRRFEWYYLERLFEGGIFTLQCSDFVTSASFGPDGLRLATAANDNTVRFWDARSGILLRELKQAGRVVAFSPDGMYVATGSLDKLGSGNSDNTARLRDAQTGAIIREFKGHKGAISALAFSPDGTRLATGSFDKTARLWDIRSGSELLKLEGHRGFVLSVAFSPEGSRLATASADRAVRVWDARTAVEIWKVQGGAGLVSIGFYPLAFSPDGLSLAAVAYDDITARLFDARTGAARLECKGHTKVIASLAFSPDGMRLATASGDETARLWDTRTGGELLELKGHASFVSSVAFSPDSSRLLTGGWDKAARVWDAHTGANTRPFTVSSLAFSPDGRRMAAGAHDKTAKVWDARTRALLLELKGHEGRVVCVAFSPDGTKLATASWDKSARIWDAENGGLVHELKGHRDDVYSVAFSPDGTRVMTASADTTARVWDTSTGAELFKLEGHKREVNCAAFSPDGRTIATASSDRTARFWDARTGAPRRLPPSIPHAYPVRSVQFSPDSSRFATGSDHGVVALYDASIGWPLLEFKGHSDTQRVVSLAFTPDGSRLATGSWDKTARLWDVRTGAPLLELKRHTDHVTSVAFSPDGTRLATAGADATIHLWEAPTASTQPDVELDSRLWATRFDPEWHAAQLQPLQKPGEWFAVLYHANQLLERFPGDPIFLNRRQVILDQAIERAPNDSDALAARATLVLQSGNVDRYRKLCADLWKLAKESKDHLSLRRAAATCLLAPQALADLMPLLEAFEKTMTDKYSDDLRIHGGLLLRSGRFEEAVARLEQAHKAGDQTPHEDLLLALAYQQLKRTETAQEHLDRATLLLDRHDVEFLSYTLMAGAVSPLHALTTIQLLKVPDNRQRLAGWQGWMELQILRREAEQTLAK